MLEIVTRGFRAAKNMISGKVELSEANIDEAVKEIQLSLLEADVDFEVTKSFLQRVKQRAVGEVVKTEVSRGKQKITASPGDHFIAICNDELEKLMGPVEGAPILFKRPVTTIMMVGLQGTGKTTTTAKLARLLKSQKRKPLLVAADVQRPAAREQLQILGQEIGVPVHATEGLTPPELCLDAVRQARSKRRDVVIFDTAGRLAIDESLMQELEAIVDKVSPDNTFLVVDAMAGRDAVSTAAEFNRRIDVSGFVMTKLDGDARGGAALSIKEITGKPIKFLGVGEGMDKLEEFRPDGLSSRILGMGDVVGLMKDFESVVDEREAKKDTRRLLSGQFGLDDFLKQMRSLSKLGSMSELLERFPVFGDGGMPDGLKIDDDIFKIYESLIMSMTPEERAQPVIIDDSRAKRIAQGSGRSPEQVQDLVGRFGMMQNMMQNIAAQPGLMGALPGFKQLAQMRQFKGQDMSDLLGDLPAPKGRPGIPPGSLGGLAGNVPPGTVMMGPDGQPMTIPPGYAPPSPGQGGQQRPQRQSKDRGKVKAKRKAQRKARKKSRKK